MRIGIVHPDLGIGGAERLIVDMSIVLKGHGHFLTIYTSHHSQTHCFQATKDGTLNVKVYGDWLPRSLLGYFRIVFALLRSLYLCLAIFLFEPEVDVIISDQIAATNPILKRCAKKLIFYCHFPDQNLADHGSILKRLYRYPFDKLEENGMKVPDRILVNSRFTLESVVETFPGLSLPLVLYPSVQKMTPVKTAVGDCSILVSDRETFLSINRFYRPKNHELAIRAFRRLKSIDNLRLLIAGGLDRRFTENTRYFESLIALCGKLDMTAEVLTDKPSTANVQFLTSFSESQHRYLLSNSICLLYTAPNEHFGYGPVEAMMAGLPVIGCKSGGLLETVVDGETGYLIKNDEHSFAEKMGSVQNKQLREDLGSRAVKRAEIEFGVGIFAIKLERILQDLVSTSARH